MTSAPNPWSSLVDVSGATQRMVQAVWLRLRPVVAAERARDVASGVPLLGDPAHWTLPIGEGTDAEPFEACSWRLSRDAHCQCFRCEKQGDAVACARALVSACARPSCWWCDSAHHTEDFAPGAHKLARATGLPLVPRPAPPPPSPRAQSMEATSLRATLRDKAPDGAVALACSWWLCLAVEPCEGGYRYRRLAMTKRDRTGRVVPTLDEALVLYRADLDEERKGRVVTERAEGESLDALLDRHLAALAGGDR